MSKNLFDMMCLDIYLEGLSSSEYQKIKDQIVPPGVKPPLLSWDFFYPSYQMRLRKATINTDITALETWTTKHNWPINLAETLKENPYEALVLTNDNGKILWVNNGFYEMTGYSKAEAIDKTPVFLQGKKTSSPKKERIRAHLKSRKPVKEVLINYRKDGTTYRCELNIFPLMGESTTHFLALERVV
jgi:PAS domain S-box-containing protein